MTLADKVTTTPGMAVRVALTATMLALLGATAHAAPDLDLEKSVDNPVPAVGQPVEFTVNVRNIGTDRATNVRVTDRLPSGLRIPQGMAAFPSVGDYDPLTGFWDVGDLGAGVGATLLIPAIVSVTSQPACIVNVAETVDVADPDDTNNRALAAVRRPGTERCVDLSVEFARVDVDRQTCSAEGAFDIVVDVTNAGPDDARSVVIVLDLEPDLAPGLRFTGPGCTGTRCTLATLDAGATVSLDAVSDDFVNTVARDFVLRVEVSSSDDDYASDDNEATDTGTIPGFTGCDGATTACAFTTAFAGSRLESRLVSLRRFRDDHLRRTGPGRTFVRFYDQHSPLLAHFLARHEPARTTARLLLAPVVLAFAYPWQAAGLVTLLSLVALARIMVPRTRERSP